MRARKLLTYGAAILTGSAILVVLAIALFGNAMLNGPGKRKAERAFTRAFPGSELTIGRLHYALGPKRLEAENVLLRTTNATLELGRAELTGIRWGGLLLGRATLTEALAQAQLSATNAHLQFARKQYGLQLARVQASVPGAELVLEGGELRPSLGEQAYFAASPFRRTRFQIAMPECRVSGLDYSGLLGGNGLRASSVVLARFDLNALVSRYKPPAPGQAPPLMVHEALAAIPVPVQVDNLQISDARVAYREQALEDGQPGVLTFGNVNLSATGIENRAKAKHAIELKARGDLMNAGTLQVQMSIPIAPPAFSLQYSGSLGPMDLTRLNDFLAPAERTRVKSGTAEEARFAIEVAAGHAQGKVRAIYSDLEIAVLDKETRSEKGFLNRLSSLLANAFKIQNSKGRDAVGALEAGVVDYTRAPEDTFLAFIWAALRTGVLDAIEH